MYKHTPEKIACDGPPRSFLARPFRKKGVLTDFVKNSGGPQTKLTPLRRLRLRKTCLLFPDTAGHIFFGHIFFEKKSLFFPDNQKIFIIQFVRKNQTLQ